MCCPIGSWRKTRQIRAFAATSHPPIASRCPIGSQQRRPEQPADDLIAVPEEVADLEVGSEVGRDPLAKLGEDGNFALAGL